MVQLVVATAVALVARVFAGVGWMLLADGPTVEVEELGEAAAAVIAEVEAEREA